MDVVWARPDADPAQLADVHPVAGRLFRSLSGDPEGTGARIAIPVRFRAPVPPAVPDLDAFGQGERRVIILIVDDRLLAGAALAPWQSFLRAVAAWASQPGRLVLGAGLSDGATKLPHVGNRWNVIRAHGRPDDEQLDAIEAAVAVALWQMLDPAARPSVFISYASADGGEIAETIRAHLDGSNLLDSFMDRVSIHAGEEFQTAVFTAVAACGLVAVHSDEYARSVWCGRELVTAKSLSRPVVVVEAIRTGHDRSFPYLGNTAVVPWLPDRTDLSLRAIVRIFVREGLRSRWFQLWVEHVARLGGRPQDRTVLFHAPELLTLLGPCSTLPRRVVYPDPPLPAVERDLLLGLDPGVDLRTPTELWAE